MPDNIFIFIAVSIFVLAFLVGVYFALREWVRKILVKKILEASIILSDHRYFEKKKNDIQLLFLGACEFREGIDEKSFDSNVVNFSVPSVGFIELFYFLKYYIDKMPSLKALVLSVGDNSFCTKTSNGSTFPVLFNKFIDYRELIQFSGKKGRLKLWWQRWFYSSSVGHIHYGRKHFSWVVKKIILMYIRKFRIQNIKRVFRERILNKTHLGSGGPEDYRQQGLVPAGKSSARKKKEGLSVGKDSTLLKSVLRERKAVKCADIASAKEGVLTHFSRPTFDEKALIYFEKFLKLCQSRNLPVITVCMPRSKYFLDIVEEEEYVTGKELSEKIVQNPRYKDLIFEHLNYLNLYRDRDDLFNPNGVELNREKGRKVFSMHLAGDISSIMQALEVQGE